MNQRMVDTAVRSIGQVDVVLWLVDVTEPSGPGDASRAPAAKSRLPVVLGSTRSTASRSRRSCP